MNIYLPSITNTIDPTSPSRIIIEPAGNVTGYMQSTISRICVSSKFFMKSLSSIAALISSRDLKTKKHTIVIMQEREQEKKEGVDKMYNVQKSNISTVAIL